ncbi:hypothetical protein N7532_005771 [Penicillium argentinense]|uniref:Zn(2)-C6 fungal-type domain-containing protein n=1 Tax=Penicillium argentinense TaxID=1131581 RepID=A0A9W9FET3_9EURO|nr:uncharacterized protein N7532_005771 [Penicillium argentinense]KAJ5098770.1 hypothetical protein N7532_005771 [Penicillium argentinense]
MTKGAGLRLYRACVRCRSRKTRCDLHSTGDPGKPPCLKCSREGADCVLAGSRPGKGKGKPSPTQYTYRITGNTTHGDLSAHSNLQNPSDALLILAHAAGEPDDQPLPGGQMARRPRKQGGRQLLASDNMVLWDESIAVAPITKRSPARAIGQSKRLYLSIRLYKIASYHANYHQFFPIVPTSILDPTNICEALKSKSFLITAVLVIALKDDMNLSSTHKAIWDYFRQRILDKIVLSGAMISSWIQVPSGIVTYLSDRQISIRMGQAFWCRGPGLSARFTVEDFPSLQSQGTNEEDLASWIQAQVELTTLFGNAHDILFASKARTVELITRGDYVKYIDDTTRALSAWKHAWRSIVVSKHLLSCLTLMHDYLRLYVNAFAFRQLTAEDNRIEARTLDLPNSAMASADARHIYDALVAAETLLRVFIEDFDAEKHLRYMPARFYLYEIHSSVFLYKVHASGAIPTGRYPQTTSLIARFITHLTTISSDEKHLSTRYARLLHRLWFRPEQPAPECSNDASGSGLGAADPSYHTHASLASYQHPGSTLASIHLSLIHGPTVPAGSNDGGAGILDELSLEPFDCMETMDGFFAMPPVFPYDLSVFFNGKMSEGDAVFSRVDQETGAGILVANWTGDVNRSAWDLSF